MVESDLVKYLKRNKGIDMSKMDAFKISFEDVHNVCGVLNLTVEEKDGRLLFRNRAGDIEDFKDIVYKSGKYKEIIVNLLSQDGFDKLTEKIPYLAGQKISKYTSLVEVDDGSATVYDTKRDYGEDVVGGDGMEVHCATHSPRLWSFFDQWRKMPEYYYNFKKELYTRITVRFDKKAFPNSRISEILEQNIHDKTDSVWFPKRDTYFDYCDIRILGGNSMPKYPIYIVSKNRYNEYRRHTSESLSLMKIHHYICVEPSQLELYEKSKLNTHEYCHIIAMDMSYKDKYNTLGDLGNANATGAGAARNFCADHAKAAGYKWCWILDDNNEDFYRMWRGRRIVTHSPEVFCHLERLVERYTNIGLAGFNYHMFLVSQEARVPFASNTRIYSFGLWNLDCPYVYQEGRYNEDTIQSLNILTHGWCTLLSNAYLGRKLRTQLVKGGNTEEIYKEKYGGTFAKSQMLAERYPEYTALVWKYGRWHHYVDYSKFTQELDMKPEYRHLLEKDYNEIDDNGAYAVKIDPKYKNKPEFDNREFLEKMYPRGCENDVTHTDIYLPEDRDNIELRNFWDYETPGENHLERRYRNEVEETVSQEIVKSDLFDDTPPAKPDKKSKEQHEELPIEDRITVLNNEIEAKREYEENYSIDNL